MIIKCSKCNKSLEESEFDKRKTSKSGYSPWCKDCRRAYSRKYSSERRKNDPGYLVKLKLSKAKHLRSEKGRQKRREYRQLEKVKEQEKEYGRQYYYANKEKRLKTASDWFKKHPDKRKIYNRSFYDKVKNDPLYRLSQRLRRLIKIACRKKGLIKRKSTFKLLGFTPMDVFNALKQYLDKPCIICGVVIIDILSSSSHLDHIIPISVAKTMEDIIRLNQLSNLRLICRTCNIKKSDNY